MNHPYFTAQLTDEAGHVAVKLQKIIAAIFCISLVTLICDIAFGAMTGVWSTGFIGTWFGYFILFCGFWGAKSRSNGFLLIYLIFMILFVIFQAIAFILAFVLVALLAGTCMGNNSNVSCEAYNGASIGGLIAVLLIATFIGMIIWVIEVYSINLAFKLRKMLLSHHQYVVVAQQQQAYVVQPAAVVYTNQPAAPTYAQPAPAYGSVPPAYGGGGYQAQV